MTAWCLVVRLCLITLAAALCAEMPGGATTYPPVTFNDLVTRADVIFIGEVIDVRPFPVDAREGTIVKTRVVFRLSDPLWGTAAALEVFEFFGGEWGGIGMAIAEMPKCAVGDRRVVFARRERSINPIVGFKQGLLQIARDPSGVDRVLTAEGMPLASPQSIGAPAASASITTIAPMRLSDFRDRITRVLAEARRR